MKVTLTPDESLENLPQRILEIRKNNAYPKPIEFILGDGIYELSRPILLDHTCQGGITLRAENPGKATISGGEVLHGLKETRHGNMRMWEMRIPEVCSGEWYFRQLFVNGRTRPRARYPKFDASKKDFKTDRLKEIRTFGKSAVELDLHKGDNTFRVELEQFEASSLWRQAEAVIMHFWVEERMPELHLNRETGWLESSYQSSFNLREAFNEKLARYYIDNLDTALTEPGEWYLNQSTGILRYLPNEDETLANTEVIAPRVRQWILVHGEPHRGNFVDHVNIEGIAFRYADWSRILSQKDRTDQPDIQQRPFPGASQNTGDVRGTISFMGSRHSKVSQCEISETGFFGIAVEKGCEDISINRCSLHDLGGGGIKITGDDAYDASWTETKNISVSDCEIHRGGRVYHAAPGIVIRHASGNRLSHNHISDFFNSGIACGCIWSYDKTRSFDNIIEGNHIHQIGQGLSNDMGGIYILGVQQGTCIRNNWIHDIEAEDYGAQGIYLDESCSHVVVECNLVHNVDGVCFIIHRGRENIARNNIFAFGKHAIVEYSKSDNHNGITFVRNIVVSKSGSPAILGGYACDIFKVKSCFEGNVYWAGKNESVVVGNVVFDQVPHYDGIDIKQWKALGQDALSFEADPKLNLIPSGYELAENSIAKCIGFRTWDASAAGPRPEGTEEAVESISNVEMKFG